MIAVELKTEFLTNPIGLDVQKPCLLWNCRGGIRQTAYRIVTDKWDSGKVATSSMRTVYPLPLEDRERVLWKICLWDENDSCGEWSEGFFEKGISEWNACWISGNYKVNRNKRYPVDCFRKKFFVREIKRARLYITACGVYEAKINGERAGNFYLAPGITDYRKRVQYQTYDVTEALRKGENEICVQLSDGWYRGSCGAWGLTNQYGLRTKLLAILEITGEDGSVQSIATDGSWDWSCDGPIRFADNKDGEIVDARKIPSFTGKALVTSHPVVPSASNNVFITEHEKLSPEVIITPSGKTVLNFGQNIAGIFAFSIDAHEGDRIQFRFGEMLDKDGEFTQKNFQLSTKKRTTPLQQVVYTCKEGRNDYKTTFAIFGFQYVLVEGDFKEKLIDCKAIAVYSDMEITGKFSSSNDLLNRFFNAALWSAKNNHADIPTDCPTRERHGWSGDAQIFCGTASYLFNYVSFAKKYVKDLLDGQHRNGKVGQIAPYGGVDFYMKAMDGSAGWSDAVVLIPWKIYSQYRDIEVLKEFYPAMKRYADFKKRTVGKWYLTSKPTGVGLKYMGSICNFGQSYGEWAEPSDVCAFKISDFISPHPEETTAYVVYLMERMSEIADLLGRKADAKKYGTTARKVQKGYQKLVSTKKYSLDCDRQAKQVRPLYMGLLDEEQTAFAKERLLKSLDNYGWRLGTGFLSTPFILDVLTKMNPEYAYRLLENEEIPGWLSMPKNGANTIWEAWEGPAGKESGIGSLNHCSKGAVVEWLFSVMCGIKVTGENEFSINPIPGGHFTYASASYKSIFGEVKSGWQRNGNKTVYSVTVPSNCVANVTLGTKDFVLKAGDYCFEI